ncbi:hypothetical protein [Rhodoferax sp.]|uniref:hypothetical protein n=1 Tax=Rhodoferax sp. TaxID=50421 RepID=UPI001EC2926D|nr:hypothetical protein [Rhodoferax sp.]MBT9507311.1 hypothetical protein [Rhodoferax sp.]
MELLKQIANWTWLLCYVFGALYVFLGFSAAVILLLSRQVGAAGRLALLVATIGVVTAALVAISFGYRFQSPQEEVGMVMIAILLACATLMLLSFGCFRAYKLFTK